MVAASLVVLHLWVHGGPPLTSPHLRWWELAAGFAAADVFVFHVEINSEAHTFSLSELPFVLGLFLGTPAQLIIGRLVGEALVLVLYERQTPVKLAFNLSLFLTECCTALIIFTHLIGGDDVRQPLAWAVAYLAVSAGAAISAAAVWTVIRWHGGRTSPLKLLAASGVTTTCNTSLAVVAGILAGVDLPAVALLSVFAVALSAAYRSYNSLIKRYHGLELLYDFTRVTSGSLRPQVTLEHILSESRRLLRADVAVIALPPTDGIGAWLRLEIRHDGQMTEVEVPRLIEASVLARVVGNHETVVAPRTAKDPATVAMLAELGARDCMVAPLVAGGQVTGVVVVADRLGEVSTFDVDDARLFSTLAAQAGVALENGRLIDRLHDEAVRREHESLHDALTGLGNRVYLRAELDRAVGTSTSTGGCAAVLVMDLDRFKEVNDALGHHTGDLLLQEVAARLRAAVDGLGTVARLGGDEFAVVLAGVTDAEEALRIAWDIHAQVCAPLQLPGIAIDVASSVGLALCPAHGEEGATLMQRADVAMYAAKASRGGVALYDPAEDWNTADRLRLANDLHQALDNGALAVHYQPIVRLSDGRVTAAEALVRWRHPQLGQLLPDDFLPIAERNGLMKQLTTHVLGLALAQRRAWCDAGFELDIAVNLPVSALLDIDFASHVRQQLRDEDVDPAALILEITETGIMSDPDRMTGVLLELVASGVQLAIDDFGTGYSSFAYLQRLPVSKVKIDKSFVLPLATDTSSTSIVRSIIELGRNLNLEVVAEGVEDQRTLDVLERLGCHAAQGYHLSRAVRGAQLTEWMRSRSAASGAGTSGTVLQVV